MPRNSRTKDIHPISFRELSVSDIRDISPSMRRITFTGDQLRAHTRDGISVPALVSEGFDDDVRLIFPDPDTGQRPHPQVRDDGNLLWPQDLKNLFRTYTVRAYNADRGEVIVDFARHGQGLAEQWSSQASVGDALYVAGPKSCAQLPTHTDWLFLTGDETALPAIGRCVESLPAQHPAVAVIEVPSAADKQQLDVSEAVTIHWVIRDEGGDFVELTKKLFSDSHRAQLPRGEAYIWAAGEAMRLKHLRRLFKDIGQSPENLEITGYWRKTAEQAGETTAPASSNSVLREIHELAELAPGFALRTAVRVNLFQAIDSGASTVERLAAALSLNHNAVGRFLRYLASLNLVTIQGSDVGLTAMGTELADPDSNAVRWLTGPAHLEALALMRIEDALRTGAPTKLGEDGLPWSEQVTREASLLEQRAIEANSRAGWVAPAAAVSLSDAMSVHERIVIVGQGGAAYADELLRRNPQVQVRIVSDSSPEGALREIDLAARARCVVHQSIGSFGADSEDYAWATMILFLDPWGAAAPAALVDELRRVDNRPLYLITQILDEEDDEEHTYEQDLVRMCMFGTQIPTRRVISQTLAHAGAVVADAVTVGWGKHLLKVSPAGA